MRCLRCLLLLALWSPCWLAAESRYAPLHDRVDPGLQSDLVRVIKKLNLSPATRNGNLALAVVDITDPQRMRVASINGDEMMYAASLPKIAILYGVFAEVDRGRIKLDPDIRGSLTRMIRYSSNDDATRMLNLVGKQRMAEILQSDPFRLYDPAMNGGLWVGKEYAAGSAFRRDPLHHISHGATAIQAARLYYLLDRGLLLSRESSTAMKEILGDPGIDHKFVKGLHARPGAKLYRKSGSWRDWHADSALVEAGAYKYIVVALAHDAQGGRWLEKLITPIHDLIVGVHRADAR